MGIARYTAGAISTGLLILSFTYYGGKIKDAEATRKKIDDAITHIESLPDGQGALLAIAKEMQGLEKMPYGQSTFGEIYKKLQTLEKESPKTREIETSRILSAAAQNANAQEAVETTRLLGAAGISGVAVAGGLIAPMIGAFFASFVFGKEASGGSKSSSKSWRSKLEELLTRDLTGVRKLRPDEKDIVQGRKPKDIFRPR